MRAAQPINCKVPKTNAAPRPGFVTSQNNAMGARLIVPVMACSLHNLFVGPRPVYAIEANVAMAVRLIAQPTC